MRPGHASVWLSILVTLAPALTSAQSSIGLPPTTRFSLGAYGAIGAHTAGFAGVSAYRDLLNPAVGLLGYQLESYGGVQSNGAWAGNIALGVRSTALRVGGGIDVDVRNGDVTPFVSFMHPLRRGGIIGRGSQLHASWLVGGSNGLRAGIALPVAQPFVGRSRPRRDQLLLPAPQVRLPAATGDLRNHVLRVNDVVLPPLDDVAAVNAALASARVADDVIAAYHAALDRRLGQAQAAAVRAALLHRVLVPYNRLLGQKREPDTLEPFTADLLRALQPHGALAAAAAAEIVVALEEVVRVQRRRMADERLVWLPLQLGLRAEQHHTQAQLDSLLEHLTRTEFTDSNHVVYVPNEQFQWEVFHSIRQARNYHVLWLHDFRGVNDNRAPDTVAYRQVAYGYLTGLLERVRAYDTEGVLPEYHIVLDQFYFEQEKSRGWMELLRDPLRADGRIAGAPVTWQRTLDSLRAELRTAAAASQRLQREARASGALPLHRRVAVQVHITQQADPAFFTPDLLPVIGLSDNALHDHRKLVFYDLTESDPYRGALLISGMGVGEVYSGSFWEDRLAIVRGTAAHAVKPQLAQLLTTNGVRSDDVSAWLRPSRDTVPLNDRAPTPRFNPIAITTMQVHNEVGYGAKQVTVAKAMLYSLLPKGAVVRAANSLWLNPLWTSMLFGHALRGGRVLLISASQENSPFKRPELALASEELQRLLDARRALAEPLAAAGGMVRVGIYDADIAVDDIATRIDTALARRARTPWLQQLEPYSREVIDSLRAVAASLRGATTNGHAQPHERPKLHVKAQFIASAEAWDNLFVQPGWGAALASYFRSLAELAQSRSRYAAFHELTPTSITHVGGTLALRQEVMSRQSELALYYLLVGSFNEDYRSALLDGEAMLVISRFGAAVGIADFVLLPSLCTWVESSADIRRYLPARASWLTRALRVLY